MRKADTYRALTSYMDNLSIGFAKAQAAQRERREKLQDAYTEAMMKAQIQRELDAQDPYKQAMRAYYMNALNQAGVDGSEFGVSSISPSGPRLTRNKPNTSNDTEQYKQALQDAISGNKSWDEVMNNYPNKYSQINAVRKAYTPVSKNPAFTNTFWGSWNNPNKASINGDLLSAAESVRSLKGYEDLIKQVGQNYTADDVNKIKEYFGARNTGVPYSPGFRPDFSGSARAQNFISLKPSFASPVNPNEMDDLPEGVTEEDVQYTMQKYGLSREEVLSQLQ